VRWGAAFVLVVGCYSPREIPDCARDNTCLPVDSMVDLLDDFDDDDDGVSDVEDNCPAIKNPTQRNKDGDSKGDVCDPCPHISSDMIANADLDGDIDGVGDACDPNPQDNRDVFLGFWGFYTGEALTGWTFTPASGWAVIDDTLRTALPNQFVYVEPPIPAERNIYVMTSITGRAPLTSGTAIIDHHVWVAVRRDVSTVYHQCRAHVPKGTGAGAAFIDHVTNPGNDVTQPVEWLGAQIIPQTTRIHYKVFQNGATCKVLSGNGVNAMVVDPSTTDRTGLIAVGADQAAIDINYLFVVRAGS